VPEGTGVAHVTTRTPIKHAAHVCDLGRVKAQGLVELSRPLCVPNRNTAGAHENKRRAGVGRAVGIVSVHKSPGTCCAYL